MRIGDRYLLGERVGQGGMGRVWRARDEMLERPVAVKELWLDGPDSDEDLRTRRERALREARASARIDHPGVVRVYDVAEEDDRLWIVMELVEAPSLERTVADHGPLSVRETVRIGLALAEALRRVHAAGVLHRDVKPGNVLLWNRPEGLVPYLCDFGIAIDGQQGLTPTGALVGSPAYMAPERHFGHAADERGDVYSVGCLLWAVLTGDAPYSGTDFQMMNSHINAPTPQLGTGHPVDEGIDEVLTNAMQKDPEQRLATADEVRQRLLAIVTGGGG